jgi:hypothetical protein
METASRPTRSVRWRGCRPTTTSASVHLLRIRASPPGRRGHGARLPAAGGSVAEAEERCTASESLGPRARMLHSGAPAGEPDLADCAATRWSSRCSSAA